MKKIQKAESFAWIIIWVFILSFVILWIANLLYHNMSLTRNYQEENMEHLIKQNLIIIAKKLDTSSLVEWERFFIVKNVASPAIFEIFSLDNCINELPVWWDESSCYINSYINKNLDLVENPENYTWEVYSQIWIITISDNSFGFTYQDIDIEVNLLRGK